MTGDVLNGFDAYVAGLASHYVPHEQIANLEARLAELHVPDAARASARASSEIFDIVNAAIDEFSVPLPRDYTFKYSIDQLNVIENCFDIGNSLKQINSRLDEFILSETSSKESKDFAITTKQILSTKSPVSLEITKELFQRNSITDIQTALTHDLITATRMSESPQLCEFAQATAYKLLQKNKTPYQWKIRDLKLSQLSVLISQNPSNPVSLLTSSQRSSFSEYPHHEKYQLPKEAAVERYITGADNQGRQTAVTKSEAIKFFQQLNPVTKGKTGVEYLVGLVIDRKCEPNQDGFLRWRSANSKL